MILEILHARIRYDIMDSITAGYLTGAATRAIRTALLALRHPLRVRNQIVVLETQQVHRVPSYFYAVHASDQSRFHADVFEYPVGRTHTLRLLQFHLFIPSRTDIPATPRFTFCARSERIPRRRCRLGPAT